MLVSKNASSDEVGYLCRHVVPSPSADLGRQRADAFALLVRRSAPPPEAAHELRSVLGIVQQEVTEIFRVELRNPGAPRHEGRQPHSDGLRGSEPEGLVTCGSDHRVARPENAL